MNVVPFNAARSRLRPNRRPVRPPPALNTTIPEEERAPAFDEVEDRMRMRQNMAALLLVVGIVVLGIWLIDALQHYSRVQACLEAGHRNCLPIDFKYQPSPFRG